MIFTQLYDRAKYNAYNRLDICLSKLQITSDNVSSITLLLLYSVPQHLPINLMSKVHFRRSIQRYHFLRRSDGRGLSCPYLFSFGNRGMGLFRLASHPGRWFVS